MIDLDRLAALAEAAGISLPVANGDHESDECRIDSADYRFTIYDEGGHTGDQARYLAALLNAAPALIALASKAVDNLPKIATPAPQYVPAGWQAVPTAITMGMVRKLAEYDIFDPVRPAALLLIQAMWKDALRAAPPAPTPVKEGADK